MFEERLLPHPGIPWILRTFHGPDGGVRLLAAGSDTALAWDPVTSEQVAVFDDGWPGTCDFVVCHPEGRDPVLAVATEEGLWWHDSRTGLRIEDDGAGTDTIWGLAHARMPDGTHTLFGANYFDPHVINRWDVATRRPLPDLGSHDNHIVAVAVVELPGRGPLVTATGWSHTIHRWDPLTGVEIGAPLVGHEKIVRWMDAVTLPDGRTLFVTADFGGQVRRWDPLTGEAVGEPIQAHQDVTTVLPLLVNGRAQLLTSSDTPGGVVRRWDALTGELLDEPATGFNPVLLTVCGEQVIATATPDGVRLAPLRLT
ncbi:WD40 repeat domain-containing protein [Catellatospora methionotrophica]|uniref:WD40 repeat domain-containing protein n=1 Tax=Catellatospora methionotrophica TaxID=121620 RepID=UPI00340DBDD2